MAAVLIAVVVALALGHGIPALAQLRRFEGYAAWLGMLSRSRPFTGWFESRFGVLLGVGLPVALVGLVQHLVHGHGFGIPAFAFSALVLFYCWGPRDLDVDVQSVLDAPDCPKRLEATAHLMPPGSEPRLAGGALVEGVFLGALSRWFGVLLWFLLLGPMGAVLYRLTKLTGSGGMGDGLPEAHRAAVGRLESILDWPVAHLMVLALALAANLDVVLGAWRSWHEERGLGFWQLDVGFLGPVALACVDTELAADEAYDPDSQAAPPPMLELTDAMSLVWRMLVLWLVVLALFVLAGVVN